MSRAAHAISFANTASQPYQSAPMTHFSDLQKSLSRVAHYNLKLGFLVNGRRTAEFFNTCAEMKQQGVEPDHTTYDLLLENCAGLAMYQEALAVFEDMVAMGMRPHELTFHHLLQVRWHFEMSTCTTSANGSARYPGCESTTYGASVDDMGHDATTRY